MSALCDTPPLLHRGSGKIIKSSVVLAYVSSDPTAAHRHQIYVSSIDMTPTSDDIDGALSVGPSIEVWDSDTGEMIRELDCHGLSVGCMVAYDIPMDARECIAAGCSDGTLKLWDAVSAEQLHAVEAHTGPISALHVYYDPVDGRPRLVSAGHDAVTHVWGGRAKKRLQTLEAYKNPIVSLASFVAADGGGARVVALDDAGKIWVYDPESGELVRTIEGQGAIHVMACLSLSSHPVIFAGGMRGRSVFDARTGGQVWHQMRQQREGNCRSVAVFQEPVGGRVCIAAGFEDSRIHIYDAESGDTIQCLHNEDGVSVSLSTYETADGRLVLVVGTYFGVHFFDMADYTRFRKIVYHDYYHFNHVTVFVTVEGHYFAAVHRTNAETLIFDTLDQAPLRECAVRAANKEG
jgi:WD40 repeat protein